MAHYQFLKFNSAPSRYTLCWICSPFARTGKVSVRCRQRCSDCTATDGSESNRSLIEMAESELVYSLTGVAEQRVKEESARLESMLSQFVEQGGMEKSFRSFLDQKKPIGDN
jgi:hypothetical protein